MSDKAMAAEQKTRCGNCMCILEEGVKVCPDCGFDNACENEAPALPAGTLLDGSYLLGRVLRSNDLTTSYMALETGTNTQMVVEEYLPKPLVKRLPDGSLSVGTDTARYRTLLSDITDRWKRLSRFESRAMPKITAVAAENGTVYCVSQWKRTRPLLDTLGKSGVMPWPKAKAKFMPVFTLLAKLHNAGLVHCGISPDNIAVDARGALLLTGFSLPEIRSQSGVFEPEMYDGYSAPEQYSRNQFQGEWTDIYSLGAVLYRVLTGITPPRADTRAKEDTLKLPQEGEPEIPANVLDGVLTAMDPDKSRRFTSVNRFTAVLLEEAGSNTNIFRGGERRPERQTSGPIKPERMMAALALLLALSVICNVVLFSRSATLRELEQQAQSQSEAESEAASAGAGLMEYDFVGMYAPVLEQKLDSYGKVKLTLDYSASEDYPDGVVFAQSVDLGEALPENGAVTVYVSTGPGYVRMPNVVGWPYKYACAYLDELGILYDVRLVNDESGTLLYSMVTSASRNEGDRLRPSSSDYPDSVTLVVTAITEDIVEGN